MKKILLILLLVFVSRFACLAQNNIVDIGFAADVGLPTGSSSTLYNVAQGGNVTFEMPSKVNNLQFMASVGYSFFNGKEKYKIARRDTTGIPNADFVPVEIGAKYYRNNFFVQGEVGASVASTTAYPGPRIGVLYTPAIGYTLPGFYLDLLDISFGYQSRLSSGGNTNEMFLRLLYLFN